VESECTVVWHKAEICQDDEDKEGLLVLWMSWWRVIVILYSSNDRLNYKMKSVTVL
jgi:hypothetical protein